MTPSSVDDIPEHGLIFANCSLSDGTPMTSHAVVGLMVKTVWGVVLADLNVEIYTAEVSKMESIMR